MWEKLKLKGIKLAQGGTMQLLLGKKKRTALLNNIVNNKLLQNYNNERFPLKLV